MALQISHSNVIDTALLYPVLASDSGKLDPSLSHGLDYLSTTILKRDMDRSKRKGVHDSIEDSINSLELAKHLVALESRKILLEPIPQRVRPRRRKRGVNYGVAATLSAISDYSLKHSFAGANEASAVVGMKHVSRKSGGTSQTISITKDTKKRKQESLVEKVKRLSQQTTQRSTQKSERSKAVHLSSRFLASSSLYTTKEKAKSRMGKLKSQAKRFSVARRRKR
mmetsp:Transcript_12938/g.15689  ORF Transcript_12938/g.15689 Transcript_12938/m.15689 type:complete len:225 (+) Transcript_12938:248-922(+)